MDQRTIFDRRAVRRQRARASGRLARLDGLLGDLARHLLDRLDDTTRRFSRALDLGGRGVVAPLLRARGIATIAADLDPVLAARSGPPCLALDEECLPFAPGSFDLVIASLSLHWVNDLPGALIQIRRALAPPSCWTICRGHRCAAWCMCHAIQARWRATLARWCSAMVFA